MNYEKVSVNIDDRKLAQIDLLVEEGFYNNRSAFINEAVDGLLNLQSAEIESLLEIRSVKAEQFNENVWFIGVSCFDRELLMEAVKRNKKLKIKGFGVLSFSKDCDDDLIINSIESVSKKIKIISSERVIEKISIK